jgi:uncharacterized repeat protein (TIGR03943 family)
VNTRTQSFVLLLFGAALCRLATSDALLRYVRPVARPWVLLAGIGMVGLAIWSLVASYRSRTAPHTSVTTPIASSEAPLDTATEAADIHGHRGASRAAWLIVAPVVAVLVVAPPALGAFSAARTPPTVTKPPDIHFPALSGPDPVPLPLIDLATRAIWDDGRTLTGRQLRLTGFVVHGDQGGFLLARLVITCCAADARPIDIEVHTASSFPAAGGWVSVIGRYAGLSPTDTTLPVVRADVVTAVKQPSNPYDD